MVALQEVETIEGDEPDFIHTLRQTHDCQVIPGHTLFRDNALYGNMILTTLPVIDSHRVDITYPGCEPRGAIAALLQAHAKTILVIATHLGLRRRERRFQADQLRSRLQCHELWERAELRILLGDFNEWHHWGPALRRIRDWFGNAPTRRSFPSYRPLLALDRIWIDTPDAMKDIRSLRTATTRIASDHLPVHATIQLIRRP